MGRLKEMLPLINIWKMAKGDEYTAEDNSAVVLTPELKESLEKIEAETKTISSLKGKAGKGISKYKVEESKLNKNAESQKANQEEKGKDEEREQGEQR